MLDPTFSNKIELSKAVQAQTGLSTMDELILYIWGKLDTSNQISELKDRLDNLSAENIPAKAQTFGLKTGTLDAARLSSRTATYTVTGENLEFSYEGIKTALPAGFSFIKGTTTIMSGTGKSTSANGVKAIIKLPTDPVQVNLKASIQTPNGRLELSKTIPIEQGTFNPTLEPYDLTTAASDLSVADFLSLLAGEASLSKSR